MLTEPERILIARGLDGLPDKAERKQLRSLLRSSRAARRLYRSLSRERQALSRLPRREAPARVLSSVMVRVGDGGPFATIPGSTQPGRRVRRPLLHTAIAASVALAVSASALWMKHVTEQRTVVRDQAQALPHVDEAAAPLPDEPPVVVSRIPADAEPVESPVTPLGPEEAPRPRAVSDKPRVVLGAPPMPALPPEVVQARLPLILSMKDASADDVRRKIADELARGTPARVDLFCSDSLKAAELIVATGRAAGVNVVLDAAANQRLRLRTPTTWLVYTESLTPQEAARWLARLAASGQSVFQTLHLPASSAQDAKELRELLGIDPAKTATPSAHSRKPNGFMTPEDVAASSRKEKPAIMVGYLPPQARGNPAHSPSVKAWLDRREEPKPGTIRLMLVVR